MAEITYREAVSRALSEALDSDERVFIMGEDIGAYGGAYAVTKGFLEKYGPRRIKDTPISESVIVGCGTGAAMAGLNVPPRPCATAARNAQVEASVFGKNEVPAKT